MNFISDISVSDVSIIPNEFGDIVKILKCDEKNFEKITEVYCSWVVPNKIKAWKLQDLQTMNLFVLKGNIRFVFIDEKDEVMKIDISSNSYKLLTIPPGIWYGFMCVSGDDGLILNSTDLAHNPDSVQRKPVDFFPITYFTD
jgi:dTDP-4-dehydrorhamnose 3,5-epimerase